MARGKDPKDDPVAVRMRRLQKALGFHTTTAFAAHLEVSVARLSNVQNGLPLGKGFEDRLIQKIPGLSLDWLRYGNQAGLSLDLARRLGELGPAGKSTTRGS